MIRVFALCLVLSALVLSCEETSSSGSSAEQITGTIVDMKVNGADFDSITVEHEGEETEIFIKDDFDYGFDLVHLHEHQKKELPVRVSIEQVDGKPYATAIDDA